MGRLNYKTEENYCEIQHALFDFDQLIKHGLQPEELRFWLIKNEDLLSLCLRDRFFNSCIPNLLCDHSKDNSEYHFSRLYQKLEKTSGWFALNLISDPYFHELSEVQFDPDLKISSLQKISDRFGTALDELAGIDWFAHEGHVTLALPYFGYNVLEIPKQYLSDLRKLAVEYYKNCTYADTY